MHRAKQRLYMSDKFCDLHTHSVFSDGTYTPEEIITAAERAGLSAVALCDHNTVSGLPRFIKATESSPVEAVCGVEFSVDYNGRELHLLGLFIPQSAFAHITALMDEAMRRKEESNILLAESLKRAGYLIDYSDVLAKSYAGNVNRAHFAELLTEKGYTNSVTHAFDTVLSNDAGHYSEPKREDVFEMIGFLTSVGAAPVLAHPFLNLNKAELEAFLPRAKEAGLLGLECLYSTYDSETTALSLDIAASFSLKPSGGSDFHGDRKPDIHLGRGRGNLQVPLSFLTELKALTK